MVTPLATGPFRVDEAAGSAAGRFADAALWRRLVEADDVAAKCDAWLAIFSAQLDMTLGPMLGTATVVQQAVVALGAADGDRFARIASYGEGREESLLLAKAAERSMQLRRGIVQSGEGPASPCQLAQPILVAGRLHGAVAVELVPQARSRLEGALRLTQWATVWFNALFAKREDGRADDTEAAALQLEALRLAGAGDTVASAGEALATFLADRLGADKLAIGVRRGLRTRMLALSHGGFAKVVNDFLAVLIGAMDEAADAGVRVATPLAADEPSTPHAAHDRLCRAHDCDWAESVPVTLPWGTRRSVTLIFVAEGTGERRPLLGARLAAVVALVAPGLAARLRAEQPMTARLAEGMRAGLRFGPSGRLRTLLLLAAVVAAVAAAALVEIDYEVTADASLEGVIRRAIVAPFDGYIAEATARPGDTLPAGAVLGRLYDRDLKLQKVDLEARKLELSRQIDEAMGKRDIAKYNILDARREQLDADLHVVNDNLARTVLVTPFAAIVVSGDKTQYIGAPVRRGDTLYEVSPLDSYRVELDVPQGDFAAVQVGQRGRLLLSSMPYRSFALHLVRITPIATVRDGKTVFRVEAALDETDPLIRPGMQGAARIGTGERSILWIWLHPLADWIRIKLWEWLP